MKETAQNLVGIARKGTEEILKSYQEKKDETFGEAILDIAKHAQSKFEWVIGVKRREKD